PYIVFYSPYCDLSYIYFHNTDTTKIYTLSLHDALPIYDETGRLNVDGMNIISNDGSNKLNRSRKARVSYKVQRTINASLNAATSTRAVCMFSCLQILEAFLWFVLITLLNVTLIILTLSVSRLLNLLLRLVAFLLFLNPQCLASISRWITASSSWKRFCLFVCRALSSIMVICMLTAIRLLLT